MKKKRDLPIESKPVSLRAFGAALRQRRETLGMTLDVMAVKTGISKPYLSNIETGRAPGPPSEGKLLQLAAALGWDADELLVAADWLRTPESIRQTLRTMAGASETTPRRADGAIDLDRLVKDAAPESPTPAGRFPGAGAEVPLREVPVINRVAAGKPAEYTDLDYPAGIAEEYVPAPELPGTPVRSAFALRVAGDSMAPEYADGDLVIVGPGDARDGDDCVVRLGRETNFATTFKRVFFVRDEGAGADAAQHVRLVALNPKYAERVVPSEEVTGIYPLLYRLTPAKRGNVEAKAPAARAEDERFSSRVSIEND